MVVATKNTATTRAEGDTGDDLRSQVMVDDGLLLNE